MRRITLSLGACAAMAWALAAEARSLEGMIPGHEIGNGGDVVVCASAYPELDGRTVMVLDHYEGKNRYGFTLELGDETLSPEAKVRLALDRLARVDATRAERYRKHLEEFWQVGEVVENLSLPHVPDDGAVKLPGPDCELKQIAYQQVPALPGDKRYLIKAELWRQLTNDGRASLLLHEIAYREAIEQGHSSSRRVRYLNALITSSHITKISHDDYVKVLEDIAKLSALRVMRGVTYELKGMQYDAEGRPSAAKVHGWEIAVQDGVEYRLKDPWVTLHPNGRFKQVKLSEASRIFPDKASECYVGGGGGVTEYYDSGVVKALSFEATGRASICAGPKKKLGEVTVREFGRFEFHPNGVLMDRTWTNGTEAWHRAADGTTFNQRGQGYLEFWPTGYLKRAALTFARPLPHVSGSTMVYEQDQEIEFRDDGLVLTEGQPHLLELRDEGTENRGEGTEDHVELYIGNAAEAAALYNVLDVEPSTSGDASEKQFLTPLNELRIQCKHQPSTSRSYCRVIMQNIWKRALNVPNEGPRWQRVTVDPETGQWEFWWGCRGNVGCPRTKASRSTEWLHYYLDVAEEAGNVKTFRSASGLLEIESVISEVREAYSTEPYEQSDYYVRINPSRS